MEHAVNVEFAAFWLAKDEIWSVLSFKNISSYCNFKMPTHKIRSFSQSQPRVYFYDILKISLIATSISLQSINGPISQDAFEYFLLYGFLQTQILNQAYTGACRP